jgi:oxygen-independent coproporphyrinogen-3 oxidase
MYEVIGERLAGAGYEQYEISNFTRGKPCAHNLVYWHDQRYLAFGPGASGYWQDTRYSTLLGPAEYISRVNAGLSVIADRQAISRHDEMGEFMMLGLRLNEGVSSTEFARRFSTEIADRFGGEIARLEAVGLLERHGERLKLTARGRLLGNEVFERFI